MADVQEKQRDNSTYEDTLIINGTKNKDIHKVDERRIELMEEFQSPDDLYEALIRRVKKYHPSDDISMIERAYKIASDAHKDQVRKSGEPYIFTHYVLL